MHWLVSSIDHGVLEIGDESFKVSSPIIGFHAKLRKPLWQLSGINFNNKGCDDLIVLSHNYNLVHLILYKRPPRLS